MKNQPGLPFVPANGIGRDAIRRAVQKIVDKDATEGEPFFVIDLGSVFRKHKQWLRALPRIEPFYAMKCCNEPKILEALASLGTGFDCASRAEIEMVLKMGVDPSRIIFAHPAKSIKHIKYAREVGVDLMTFDNETELIKVKEHHPAARMVLRILADDPHATCQVCECVCVYLLVSPSPLSLSFFLFLSFSPFVFLSVSLPMMGFFAFVFALLTFCFSSSV
jgi:ornithine decarboxylase